MYFLSFGKLNSARLLSGWIRHLFLNIAAPPGYPKETILIGRDPKGKKPVVTCSFPALELFALKYFKDLTQIYDKGKDRPFYFFCETAWLFVQALLKEKFEPGPSELNLSKLNPLELDPIESVPSELDLLEHEKDLIFKAMNKSKTIWYGGYYQTGEKENRYVSLCVENNDPFESVDALLASGFVQNALTVYKPLLENLKIT